MIASNVLRSSASVSSAMSGGPSTGRPIDCCANTIRSTSRSSSVRATSITVGTSGSCRMRSEPELEDEIDLLVAQPVRTVGEDRRIVPVADALDLAALHREHHFGAALIARHDLEAGRQHAVDRIRKNHAVGIHARAADDELAIENIGRLLDRRVCHATATPFSLFMLPIQLNRRESKRAPVAPNRAAGAMLPPPSAMTVPSRGAWHRGNSPSGCCRPPACSER